MFISPLKLPIVRAVYMTALAKTVGDDMFPRRKLRIPSWVTPRGQSSHKDLSELRMSSLSGSEGGGLYLSARLATPRRERSTLLLTGDRWTQWRAVCVHLKL